MSGAFQRFYCSACLFVGAGEAAQTPGSLRSAPSEQQLFREVRVVYQQPPKHTVLYKETTRESHYLHSAAEFNQELQAKHSVVMAPECFWPF